MLQKVHDHLKGWVVALLIGVLAISFVIWGLQYYWQSMQGDQGTVAIVNGEKIPSATFEAAFRNMQREALARGIRVNAQLSAELRQLTLDEMVQNLLWQQGATRAGFVVTEAQAVQWLSQFPPFQEKGHFSRARLDAFLASQGMTLPQLVTQIRDSILIHQVELAFLSSAFVLPNEWQAEYRRLYETRDARYVVIPASLFQRKQVASLSVQKAYYAAHQQDFRLPVRVKVEYVMLSPEHQSSTQFTQQVERLGELAYTETGSLSHVAQKLHAIAQTSGWIAQGNTKFTGADAWLAAPTIQSTLWGQELLRQGLNSEPQTLPDGRVVVFRVASQTGGNIPSFEQVRSQIAAQVGREWVLAQSALVANQVANVLQAGRAPTPVDWAPVTPAWVTVQNVRRVAQPVHPDSTLEALRPVIFSLKKQPTSAGIATLPNGDSAVVVLTDIHVPLPTKVAAKEQEKFEQFLVKRNGELAYRLYTKGLYASANIVNHLH